MDVIVVDRKANTCYELSLFKYDGGDITRFAPCIDIAKRPCTGMTTFPCRASRIIYRATRDLRVTAQGDQGKESKPEDWIGHEQEVIDCLKNYVSTKVGVVLRRAFLVFEKHMWIDPMTGDYAIHIHLVWEVNKGFAWKDMLKKFDQDLGLKGWLTLWDEKQIKEWGYTRGSGFSKYVQYLTDPSSKKQPWMMDANPTLNQNTDPKIIM